MAGEIARRDLGRDEVGVHRPNRSEESIRFGEGLELAFFRKRGQQLQHRPGRCDVGLRAETGDSIRNTTGVADSDRG